MKKRRWMLPLVFCLLLTACGNSEKTREEIVEEPAKESVEESAPPVTINPLPENVMANLADGIFSVSLEEGGAYVDDTGKMQMDVKIYNYDKYDMVDISGLKVGDIIVTHAGEVKITSLERKDHGSICINDGLEAGGFDLFSDECGIYFEVGFNDAKNWYEVGEATLRVSVDFKGYDNADPDKGEVIIYPGDFLIGEVANYDFTPYNTTIRLEEGQIVEMNRVYVP